MILANFLIAKSATDNLWICMKYSAMHHRRLEMYFQNLRGRHDSRVEMCLYKKKIEEFVERAKNLIVNKTLYFQQSAKSK